jgi:hypothetical protein
MSNAIDKALEALKNDPVRKAIEAFENDPVRKALEAIKNDPIRKAIEMLENDPVRKALEALENDPVRKAIEALESDPIRRALEDLENSPMQKAIEAIERTRPSTGQYHLPELRMPELHMPEVSAQEEVNEYQSAGALIQRLADSITQWRQQLPPEQQPAIIAILNGGIQIRVERLAEESFHGIRIEGKIAGNPCMVLAHQSTVQLLCYIEEIEQEEQRRSIGFIVDGKEQQI